MNKRLLHEVERQMFKNIKDSKFLMLEKEPYDFFETDSNDLTIIFDTDSKQYNLKEVFEKFANNKVPEFVKAIKKAFPNDNIELKPEEGATGLYVAWINGKENEFNYINHLDITQHGYYYNKLVRWTIIELKFIKKFGVVYDADELEETLESILD